MKNLLNDIRYIRWYKTAACLTDVHITVAGLATMARRTERPLMVAKVPQKTAVMSEASPLVSLWLDFTAKTDMKVPKATSIPL